MFVLLFSRIVSVGVVAPRAKRSPRAPGYFTLLMPRFHLSQVIIVTLHAHKEDNVIIKSEAAESVAHPGRKDCPSNRKPYMMPDPRHKGLIYCEDVIYLPY